MLFGEFTIPLKGLTALYCPSVNCYRRLNRCVAPGSGTWGYDDRTATMRVKASSPSATYMENRLPSSVANPYLVMAGTIAAGIDGINRKLKCPPPRDQDAAKLPLNLEEALQV